MSLLHNPLCWSIQEFFERCNWRGTTVPKTTEALRWQSLPSRESRCVYFSLPVGTFFNNLPWDGDLQPPLLSELTSSLTIETKRAEFAAALAAPTPTPRQWLKLTVGEFINQSNWQGLQLVSQDGSEAEVRSHLDLSQPVAHFFNQLPWQGTPLQPPTQIHAAAKATASLDALSDPPSSEPAVPALSISVQAFFSQCNWQGANGAAPVPNDYEEPIAITDLF